VDVVAFVVMPKPRKRLPNKGWSWLNVNAHAPPVQVVKLVTLTTLTADPDRVSVPPLGICVTLDPSGVTVYG
jgi:hypothetical protein